MAQCARRLLTEHGDLGFSEPSHVAIETATFSVKEDTKVFLKSIFFPLGHTNMAVRMLVSFVSCTQTRATWGKGALSGGITFLRLACKPVYASIFWINDCCGRTQPILSSAISGMVLLATLRHALAEPPRLSWNLFCSPSSLELVIALLQSLKQLQRQAWATRLNFFSQGIALPSSSSKNPLLPDVLEHSSLAHWTASRNQLSTTTSLTSADTETLSWPLSSWNWEYEGHRQWLGSTFTESVWYKCCGIN